jgi:hypothetical protein
VCQLTEAGRCGKAVSVYVSERGAQLPLDKNDLSNAFFQLSLAQLYNKKLSLGL